MQDFRELKVWQKAHGLVLEVYLLTDRFPKSEQFGLTSQLRRAAASIAANIVEGRGAGSEILFRRHLRISLASAFEVEYFLVLAGDLKFGGQASIKKGIDQVAEVRRMLHGLIQSLTASTTKRTNP